MHQHIPFCYIALILFTLAIVRSPGAQVMTVEAFGLEHEPLGQATLEVIGAGEDAHLVVSDIGPSGEDGVVTRTGVVDLFSIEIEEPDEAGSLIVEAHVRGVLPRDSLVRLELHKNVSDYAFLAHLGEAGDQLVTVYDGTVLVGQATLGVGQSFTTDDWPSSGLPTGKRRHHPFTLINPVDNAAFGLAFARPTDVRLPDGLVLVGDYVVLERLEPLLITAVERVAVRGVRVPDITLKRGTLAKFGLPHVALGGARFLAEPDILTLSNLAAEPGSGVRVEGPPFGSSLIELVFEPLASSEIFVQLAGIQGDVQGVWGELYLGQTEDGLEVLADFSPLGAAGLRVEVYDDGRFAGDGVADVVTWPGLGPIVGGSTPPVLERLGARAVPPVPIPYPSPQVGFIVRMQGPRPILLPDGSSFVGDAFRVLAEEPKQALPEGRVKVQFAWDVGGAPTRAPAGRGVAGGGGPDEVTILDEVATTPTVFASADPVTPPVVIPPGGDRLPWRFDAANAGPDPVALQFWTEVVLPSGDAVAVLGPTTVTLPPGAVVGRTLRQNVPAAAPPGTYVYRLMGGTYPSEVVVTDGFVFEKAPPRVGEAAAITAGDWAVAGDWNGTETAEDQTAAVAAAEGFQAPAHPNPAFGHATLSFSLAEAEDVRLSIYDALGREVAVLVDGPVEAGAHAATFDAAGLAAGTYVYRLVVGGDVQTGRLTLLR